METPCGTEKREKSTLEQETERINQVTDNIRMLLNKMLSINSKILGDIVDKTPPGLAAEKVCRSGMIGALQDAVDTHKEEVSNLETSIRRLEDSGVI